MVLVDKGNGEDIQFGHTDYYTGEGRGITHSENRNEQYVNPKLTVKERTQISKRDNNRRNKYCVSLFCKNNTQIIEFVQYNPLTEALSLSWQVMGHNGKQVLNITAALDSNRYL